VAGPDAVSGPIDLLPAASSGGLLDGESDDFAQA
jgi:hypothetical protein